MSPVLGFALVGIQAIPIRVEVRLERRLPRTTVIGLPPAVAKETIERVRSAIESCGYAYPKQRVVVEVTPADVPHASTGVDLAIAVAILVATQQIPHPEPGSGYHGELGLDGSVRPVRGSIAVARGCNTLISSSACAGLAALGGRAIGISHLGDVAALPAAVEPPPLVPSPEPYDLADVRGIDLGAIDTILDAVATGRPLLLVGAPGLGKTMIAQRPDIELSAPTLYRAVSIYELVERHRLGVSSVKHLGPTHLYAIATAPEVAQEALIREAEQNAMTVAEIRQRKRAPDPAGAQPSTAPIGQKPRGRPKMPPLLLAAREMVKRLNAEGDGPVLSEEELRALKAEHRDELVDSLRRVRDRCDRVLSAIEGRGPR